MQLGVVCIQWRTISRLSSLTILAFRYVTWEIAPGLLADGSIVDVWGQKDDVEWHLPGTGAPCTSTSRRGRWRSFPYLAELQGEEGEVLWSYLCRQWDRDNNVEEFPGRKLIKFNFFMLQADVLPNMGFSATRKRLIHSFECVKTEDEPSAFTNDVRSSQQEEGDSSDPESVDQSIERSEVASSDPDDGVVDTDGGSDVKEASGSLHNVKPSESEAKLQVSNACAEKGSTKEVLLGDEDPKEYGDKSDTNDIATDMDPSKGPSEEGAVDGSSLTEQESEELAEVNIKEEL
jgi:hypothetical protein